MNVVLSIFFTGVYIDKYNLGSLVGISKNIKLNSHFNTGVIGVVLQYARRVIHKEVMGQHQSKRLNSRRVYAVDDVEALPPKDVFPLTVDRLNQKFLHEDHPLVLVDIPCRSNMFKRILILHKLTNINFQLIKQQQKYNLVKIG